MKINNPVSDLTPTLNELEKTMSDQDKQNVNDLLDSIKPLTDEELNDIVQNADRSKF